MLLAIALVQPKPTAYHKAATTTTIRTLSGLVKLICKESPSKSTKDKKQFEISLEIFSYFNNFLLFFLSSI